MKQLCSALGLILSVLALSAAESRPPARPAQPQGVVSPEIHADRSVTFRVRAVNATNVTVSGEWPGGTKPMTRDERGVWSVTLGPLEPDLYGYSFSIDGFQTIDPGNSAVKPMRSPRTSILEIPGETPKPWEFVPSMPHGTVRVHTYQSKSLGRKRGLQVYTPPGYDQKSSSYPVLYLLHGSGDNEATWTALGRAQFITDALLAEGKARPMIIVMTDGHAMPPQSVGTNAADRARATGAYESDLLGDVMPFVEKNYRVKSGPANRAIIGLSMGGGQSLTIGLNHPELFAWVGGMSAAVSDPEKTIASALKDAKATNKKLKLLWFACGKDDFLLKRNQDFAEILTRHGIQHEYRETAGNHSWPIWRKYLVDFLPLVFTGKN